MGTKKGPKQKQRITLPPELPPEATEEEIEVSDEDLQFVSENRDYAGFVSRLDTQAITKHVTRVADVKEDALEALYEKRLKKKQLLKQEEDAKLEVHRVDALPVKTLDGKLEYRTVPKASKPSEDGADEEEDTGEGNKGVIKLTKVERRAKLKKSKREAKKQGKDFAKPEVDQTPQASVLAEVKEDITIEEAVVNKKRKIAELGTSLLSDPEANIKSLKELLQICKDNDQAVVKLGLLSLLAVFKDIIPGYRIRLPTEKELEMKVSKDVKKMRFYESTLLSSYKAYLQNLVILEKQPSFQHVAVRCIATLLEAVPYFNFRDSLLSVVVRNISSSDDVVRRLCCSTMKSIFANEGKHGGEATVEAVRLIADHVKAHNCQLHPDTIEVDVVSKLMDQRMLLKALRNKDGNQLCQVFLSLSFAEDIGRLQKTDDKKKGKYKKNKKRKNPEEPNQVPENDRKKNKREQMTKMREEVEADYKSAAFTADVMEQKRMQTETLSAVFETYFRVLKHTVQPFAASVEANSGGGHPLLAPCLRGLGKYSHLIDLDFMGDLIKHLKMLASSGSNPENTSGKNLTVSERLQCCIVAFKVMKSNLDALNVDLQGFFVQLYNIILEYRPGRDLGEVLAEALKIMLCDDRQHDMQKAAAFVKRLATFSLCFGSAESMAALVTLKHLLQKNIKCRSLLENDAGGGSVSGSVAKYHPYASDPNLSGALASVLWELSLLSNHYHPSISTMASSISTMNSSLNQVYLTNVSPIQAFNDLSLQQHSLSSSTNIDNKSNGRRKRGTASSVSNGIESSFNSTSIDEVELRKKFSAHFVVLRDIKENQRLRSELDHKNSSLRLYEEYKEQKRKDTKVKFRKGKALKV